MEEQLLRSLKKTVKMKGKEGIVEDIGASAIPEIDVLGQDLLQSILIRLPAKSFACAACVCRCWNSICNRVLSCPKLSSAISFEYSPEKAVEEIVEEVLSAPIRPHFALFTFADRLEVRAAHELIKKKFGLRVPTVTWLSKGVIGRNMDTNELERNMTEAAYTDQSSPPWSASRGFLLTVGFIPGLKVHTVPLLVNREASRKLLIEEFVTNIRDYSLSVSGSASPVGIMLFADQDKNIKPILRIMEYAFSSSTVIVGDMGCQFLYECNSRNSTTGRPSPSCAAVALVFARDRNKPVGIGETRFGLEISRGMTPIGPPYRTVSAKCNEFTSMLTAVRVRHRAPLDGQSILEEIYTELGDRTNYPDLYIGVTKRRRCSVGTEKDRRMQFLEFHEVMGGNEEYLFVSSVDIQTREPFRFYVPNPCFAESTRRNVYDNLRCLKQRCDEGKEIVFGGILFVCCGRGTEFLEEPVADTLPFRDNFPNVTLAGAYCCGEIGRGDSRMYEPKEEEGDEDEGVVSWSCQHVYSTAYLVMSYTPPQN